MMEFIVAGALWLVLVVARRIRKRKRKLYTLTTQGTQARAYYFARGTDWKPSDAPREVESLRIAPFSEDAP